MLLRSWRKRRGQQGNSPFTCGMATVIAETFLSSARTLLLLTDNFFLTSHLSYGCLSEYLRLICTLLIPHCSELEAKPDIDLSSFN